MISDPLELVLRFIDPEAETDEELVVKFRGILFPDTIVGTVAAVFCIERKAILDVKECEIACR